MMVFCVCVCEREVHVIIIIIILNYQNYFSVKSVIACCTELLCRNEIKTQILSKVEGCLRVCIYNLKFNHKRNIHIHTTYFV